jgi:hypothetical protein
MQPLTIVVMSILLIGLVHAVPTYTLDSSCYGNSNGAKARLAAAEAIYMARTAVTRITNHNDEVTERLFNTIFKAARSAEPRPLG